MNVIVLTGGISPERNISLLGGKAIYNALSNSGHNVKAVDPALGTDGIFDINSIEIPNEPVSKEELKKYNRRDLLNCINSDIFDDVDCAFVLLHGENGEDGLIQSALNLRGVPYTGSGYMASAIAMDKLTSKMLFNSSGVPAAPFSVMEKDFIEDLELIEQMRNEVGRSLVVKPSNQGSAVGISLVKDGNLDDIKDALKLAAQYSDEIMLETYIPGREITVGILNGEALPVVEIKPKEGYYDFNNKYKKGNTEYICPADLPDETSGFAMNIAETAAGVVGVEDFGRVDFRLTDEGQLVCLEVNTIPGFTELSLLPMAAKEAGYSFEELCNKILELGIESSKRGK